MEDDPLTPAERAIFTQLEEIVLEELIVSRAMGRFESADGEQVTASLIADAVHTVFELRLRSRS